MLPLLEVFQRDLYHCSDCNYCVDAVWPERGLSHVCPTMQSHTPLMSYSGRGYIAAARAWVEGRALDLTALGERVFTCTTCNHCETVCPIGLRPTQIGRALRGELWTREQVPAAARALREAMQRDGNPHGVPRAARSAWQAALPAGADSPRRIRYLPGCAAATAQPREAQAAVQLIRAAGFAVDLLGDQDTCCGAPLFELGLDADAEFMRESLAARCAGGPDIVSSGLECLRSWERREPAQPKPRRFAEWLLAQLVDERLQLRAHGELPVVHLLDSCQTRHHDEFAQSLRDLLAHLGVRIAAASSSARHVVCCGAAGGMPQMAPASAQRMAAARLAAEEAGVHVSADPRCVAHLRRAQPSSAVYGIAEFVHTHFAVV